MRIYLNEYKKACTDYKQNWALLNEILYKMCKDYRSHKNLSAINAKVWIIGRTYATGIERMISSSGAQGDSLGQLAKHMYKNRTVLDSIFTRLLSVTEPGVAPDKAGHPTPAFGPLTLWEPVGGENGKEEPWD